MANLKRYRASARPGGAELSLAAVLPASEAVGHNESSVRSLARDLEIRRIRFRPLLPLGRAASTDGAPLCPPPVVHSAMRRIEAGFWPVSSCGLGQNLYIDPEGEAFPCYAYHGPHTRLGNVLREGLGAIAESQRFLALGKHSVDTNQKCRTCDVRYLCGGTCRAFMGEFSEAALDFPPPDCSAYREDAQRLLARAERFLGL